MQLSTTKLDIVLCSGAREVDWERVGRKKVLELKIIKERSHSGRGLGLRESL